jgi:hypothetical protein
MEAKGEEWSPAAALIAFGHSKQQELEAIRGDMAQLCQRHKLPPKTLVVRFLATEAARLEAEAAEFAGGPEQQQDPAQRVRLLLAISKCARGKRD